VDVTKTVLVFGKSGQVARELARIPPTPGVKLEFAGRDRCDLISQSPSVLIAASNPIGVINAAAYTAVDRAEVEPDAAYRLNRDVVGDMAEACAKLDIPFVHLSTDYVFDGAKSEPYVETDPRNPISVYGASKAAGEEAVEAAGGRWTIFRTAWVFSPFGANFIKTMLRLAAERDEVNVVADQSGRPTLAADIAGMAMRAVQKPLDDHGLTGLFHLAGSDDAVWADVADAVFDHHLKRTGRRPRLNRIATADYPTPAQRPANSRLDSRRLQQAADWRPRPWRDCVQLCLEQIDP
jgi:dTDP-4-dehydrorhamnose reductase